MNLIKLLMSSMLSLSGNAQLMGAQKDPSGNGCSLDGGYSWCENLNECIRPWEKDCIIAVPIDPLITDIGPVIDCSTPCPPPTPCPMPYMDDINLKSCKLDSKKDACGCMLGCPSYSCSQDNNDGNCNDRLNRIMIPERVRPAIPENHIMYDGTNPSLMKPVKNVPIMTPPLVGSYVPQCDDSGNYKSMQCHGSIGSCWCSDEKGNEIDNTRTMCRGNCNLNEQICDTIKDKHACNSDDDCHEDQFCRITSSNFIQEPCECFRDPCDCSNTNIREPLLGGRRLQSNKPISVCINKSDEGDSCGGYTMPEYQTRCKDELECANTMGPMIADAPGTCSKPCLNNQTRNDYGICIIKLPDNCATWFDGCNTCSVNNGQLGACTLMYCHTNNEAKCTSYYKNGNRILNIGDICYRFCEDNSQYHIDNKEGCPDSSKCKSSFNLNSVSMIAYDSCDDRAWTCQNPYH